MAEEILPLTIKDLTTGAINGTGVFDELQSTIQVRLDREYEKNRIKGTEYSQVYLGAMEASMQQSIVFLLGKDKAANEANLVLAQIALAEAQKDKVLAEIELLELEKPKVEAQIRAIDKGIEKMDAEISMLGKQEDKVDKDIELATQQILNAQEEVKKTKEEVKLVTAQTSKVGSEKILIDRNAANALIQGTVLSNQASKLGAESSLIQQKKVTETYQTSGTPGGMLGGQLTVLKKQAEGFDRSAEQKAAKTIADVYAVVRGTEDSYTPPQVVEDNETSALNSYLVSMASKAGL